MLRGELVGLRARQESDVAALHAGLHDNVSTKARSDSRPWRPVSLESGESPYAISARDADPSMAVFSVVILSDDDLAGDALLWGIDLHNRMAHIGLSLFPEQQGKGLGTDVVRVLCHYGFVVRGLHRLQVDTLADNGAMIAAARRVGFTVEGTLRRSAWVTGEFVDEVIMGLLVEDWKK